MLRARKATGSSPVSRSTNRNGFLAGLDFAFEQNIDFSLISVGNFAKLCYTIL